MKKIIKFSSKIVAFVLLTALFLFGCGTNEVVQTESQTNSEHTQETSAQETLEESSTQETMQETSESMVAPIVIDVQEMLVKAEEEASALQKKLTEDSTLKQSEMNELSYEIYCVWDDLLNELWAILKDTLDENTMNTLLEEQRAWITMKEAKVKEAGEAFAGGSMAPLVTNQKGAELTKIRVYELAMYLGFEGNIE